MLVVHIGTFAHLGFEFCCSLNLRLASSMLRPGCILRKCAKSSERSTPSTMLVLSAGWFPSDGADGFNGGWTKLNRILMAGGMTMLGAVLIVG